MTKQEIATKLDLLIACHMMSQHVRDSLTIIRNEIRAEGESSDDDCEDNPCRDDDYLWICVPKDYSITLTPCE